MRKHDNRPVRKKAFNSVGRPQKLSKRYRRRLLRLVYTLRDQDPNWTVKRLMSRADITGVSRRTVSRFLNKQGFYYLQARKKGLLSSKDKDKRVKFARAVLQEHNEDFWTRKIAFYLDAAGFVYKRNPKDQALAPRGRVWRMKKEGLMHGCTSKGRACGTGGNYVKMIVAISHGKGAVIQETYEHMNGEYFAEFLKNNFDIMVQSAEKDSRLWVQDGDPSQNSKVARAAMESVNAQLFSIPPRSPDMNPIENIFSIVKRKLNEDAISQKICIETKDEFETRIKRTIESLPLSIIDNTIESMYKRMQMIIDCKGDRLKY